MVQKKENLSILVISEYQGTNANVIRDYLFSFNVYSKHKYYYVYRGRDIASDMDMSCFDIILIFWSTVVYGPNCSLSEEIVDKIKKSSALKVLFLQDEYRDVREVNNSMCRLGIQLMFTCVEEKDHDIFYPTSRIPTLLSTYTVLTGYVPKYLENPSLFKANKRTIDIGYRSRNQPYYLGDLAREKIIVAEKFKNICEENGFIGDISIREEDRIYGKRWVDFLGSCSFTLGTGSGASVIDFTGDIRRKCENYLRNKPYASYEEVKRIYFEGTDGTVKIDVISPRFFESVALGNTLICHEGNYSGILLPDRHFICVKKDYSNISDVIDRMKDKGFCRQLAKNSYEDIIESRKYNYQSFVKWFDSVIEKYVSKQISTSSISKFKFYEWSLKENKQFMVPYKNSFIVLPCKTGISYILNVSLSKILLGMPIFGKLFVLHGGDPNDNLLKGYFAFKMLFKVPVLRKVFITYLRNKKNRKEIRFDLLLEEIFRLGIIWQAQTGRLTAGHPFKVTVKVINEDEQIEVSSKHLAEVLNSKNEEIDNNLKEIGEIELLLLSGKINKIIWDHSGVSDWVPYAVTSKKWLSVKPSFDRRFHLDTLVLLDKLMPKEVSVAFSFVLRGYGNHISRGTLNNFEKLLTLDNIIRGYITLKLSLHVPTLKKLVILYLKEGTLRSRISIDRFLSDILKLGIIWQAQNGRLTAGQPFITSVYFEPDKNVIKITSHDREKVKDVEITHDETDLSSVRQALSEGKVERVLWNHSSVNPWVPYKITKRKWISINPGYDGVFNLETVPVLNELVPQFSSKFVDLFKINNQRSKGIGLGSLFNFASLVRGYVAIRVSIQVPQLRRILYLYFKEKKIRRQISIDKFLSDMLKLGIIWQAQNSRLTAGHPFTVSVHSEPNNVIRLTSHYNEKIEDVEIIRDETDLNYIKQALSEGKVKEVLWDHSDVNPWVPYKITKRKWISITPGNNGIFNLETVPSLNELVPQFSDEFVDILKSTNLPKPNIFIRSAMILKRIYRYFRPLVIKDQIRVFDNKRKAMGNVQEMHFYFEILGNNEKYNYTFDIKGSELKETCSPEILKLGNEMEHYLLFMPSGASYQLIKNKITVKGITFDGGHKAVMFLRSRFEFKNVEPILASNELYPNNSICGFKINGVDYYYILLMHSGENRQFMGAEKIEECMFSVMNFIDGDLDRIWSLDKNSTVCSW